MQQGEKKLSVASVAQEVREATGDAGRSLERAFEMGCDRNPRKSARKQTGAETQTQKQSLDPEKPTSKHSTARVRISKAEEILTEQKRAAPVLGNGSLQVVQRVETTVREIIRDIGGALERWLSW